MQEKLGHRLLIENNWHFNNIFLQVLGDFSNFLDLEKNVLRSDSFSLYRGHETKSLIIRQHVSKIVF